MRNMIKLINQELKQSPNGSVKYISGETKRVLPLQYQPNLLKLLSINRKNPQLPQGLLNCNNKTYNYVHYISSHEPVSRPQITLFNILGVTLYVKVKILFIF